MKSIEEQKADKAKRIAELLVEHSTCIAKAMNENLPKEERAKNAMRAIIIQRADIPIVLAQPLQRKEYPKGSANIVGESGSEMICRHEAKSFITKQSKVYLIPNKKAPNK